MNGRAQIQWRWSPAEWVVIGRAASERQRPFGGAEVVRDEFGDGIGVTPPPSSVIATERPALPSHGSAGTAIEPCFRYKCH
jgi:hypothetical protein